MTKGRCFKSIREIGHPQRMTENKTGLIILVPSGPALVAGAKASLGFIEFLPPTFATKCPLGLLPEHHHCSGLMRYGNQQAPWPASLKCPRFEVESVTQRRRTNEGQPIQ